MTGLPNESENFMLKFSIIIPVYNSEKYIAQCVDSILGQNYKDYEVILVDDCSSDHSWSICKHYAAVKNVIALRQETNQGVSAARNRGIEVASGEYILFVDSDDFVSQEYLPMLDKLLCQSKVELLQFGHYNYVIDLQGKSKISTSNMNVNIVSQNSFAWNELFINSFFASPWNKVYLREYIMRYEVRFDTDCVCYEDYLFNVEYCRHISCFLSILEPLYYYRQFMEINHVSKRKWGKRFDVSEKVAKATNAFIALHSADENLNNLRRYSFKAFMVELEAARFNGTDYHSSLAALVQNNYFLQALRSIKPRGKLIGAFLLCRSLHLHPICRAILKTML